MAKNDNTLLIPVGLRLAGPREMRIDIGLKLTDHIDWSWWWVLSPIWTKFAFLLLVIVVVIIVKKRTGWKPSDSGKA